MASEPFDDIVARSKTQARWRQDCLRRLAIANDLSNGNEAELLGMIKSAAGLTLAETPATADPFTKAHFSGGSHTPIVWIPSASRYHLPSAAISSALRSSSWAPSFLRSRSLLRASGNISDSSSST